MVMQIESSPALPIEQEREELVKSIFVEFGRGAVHGALGSEVAWEQVGISDEKARIGDQVVRLVDKKNGPTDITLEKRDWDLSAPGVIVFNGLRKVFQGTIERAMPQVSAMGYKL